MALTSFSFSLTSNSAHILLNSMEIKSEYEEAIYGNCFNLYNFYPNLRCKYFSSGDYLSVHSHLLTRSHKCGFLSMQISYHIRASYIGHAYEKFN